MTDKERIEVYVNELPKSCEHCTIYKSYLGFCLTEFSRTTPKSERHNKCPLKTIQLVQNQRAVEALEKVKEQIDDEFICESDYKALDIIINQIIKEYGGKDD